MQALACRARNVECTSPTAPLCCATCPRDTSVMSPDRSIKRLARLTSAKMPRTASPNASAAMLNCVISLASENTSTNEGARSFSPSIPSNSHPHHDQPRLMLTTTDRRAHQQVLSTISHTTHIRPAAIALMPLTLVTLRTRRRPKMSRTLNLRIALVQLLCMSNLRQAQVSHRCMRAGNYLTSAGHECSIY